MLVPQLNLLVGTVRIVEVIEFDDVEEFNKHHEKHGMGDRKDPSKLPYEPVTYAWVLEDPVPFDGNALIEIVPRHGAQLFVKMWLPGTIVSTACRCNYWELWPFPEQRSELVS